MKRNRTRQQWRREEKKRNRKAWALTVPTACKYQCNICRKKPPVNFKTFRKHSVTSDQHVWTLIYSQLTEADDCFLQSTVHLSNSLPCSDRQIPKHLNLRREMNKDNRLNQQASHVCLSKPSTEAFRLNESVTYELNRFGWMISEKWFKIEIILQNKKLWAAKNLLEIICLLATYRISTFNQ